MESIIIEQERGGIYGVVFLVCSSFFSGVLGLRGGHSFWCYDGPPPPPLAPMYMHHCKYPI